MKNGVKLSVLLAMLCGACSNSNVVSDDVQGSDVNSTSSALINGTADFAANHRAVVALIDATTNEVFCTGTLVSPKHVITAADCVAELADDPQYVSQKSDCEYEAVWKIKDYRPGAGNFVIGFGNNADEATKNTYDVKEIRATDDYAFRIISTCDENQNEVVQDFYENDIAIIELEIGVSSNVAVPIPVLPPWLDFEAYFNQSTAENGIPMTLVGFGYDENGSFGTKKAFAQGLADYCLADGTKPETWDGQCVFKADIEVNACHPDPDVCAEMGVYKYVYHDMLLPRASLLHIGKSNACYGDFGGPALFIIGGREYLAGVSSYTDLACNGFSVSTLVPSYYPMFGYIPEIYGQIKEVCGNGIDDDNNGLMDDKDPACTPCDATFTYHNEYTNKESGGEDDFDVYLVGSFNVKNNGDWILDDDNYKMTSDMNGTHSITVKLPKGSYEYKYYVKGWKNEETGQDDGFQTDAEDGQNALAEFYTCGQRFGYKANEPYCGNGILDDDEFCDGDEFFDGLNTCDMFDKKFPVGLLKCTKDCQYDASECKAADDEGGIGNVSGFSTRSSLDSESIDENGSISIKDFMSKPSIKKNDDKPSTDKPADDKPSTDKPADDKPSTDKPADDSKDDDGGCSAAPLSPANGGSAILFGLAALLLGLRRRKESDRA